MATVLATPGVYIEEKSAFPNSAVPVATAVPAFLGYTEKATRNKKDLKNHPTRISSFGEYLLYFGGAPKTLYSLQPAADPRNIYELGTKSGRFLLYYSMKLFFANGGSDCYVVSVGDYTAKPKLSDFDNEEVINGETVLSGIRTLLKEPEPTMVVIPEAVLLEESECGTLQGLMLAHCQKMASRVSILDVYMDENSKLKPDTREIVASFRNNIGANNLMWGAAYYPWLRTNITGAESVDFNNLEPDAFDALISLLNTEVAESVKEGLATKRAEEITKVINKITTNTAASAAAANAVKRAATAVANAAATTGGPIAAAAAAADKAAASAEAAAEAAAAKAAADAAKTDADAAKAAADADKTAADTAKTAADAAKTAADTAKTAADTAAAAAPTDTQLAAAAEKATADATAAAEKATEAAAAVTAAAAAVAAAAATVTATTADATAAATAKTAADTKATADATAAATAKTTADTAIATAKTDAGKAAAATAASAAAAATTAANAAVAASVANDKTLHQTLLAISPLYKSIMNSLREKINLLPPSAGLAGIYSMVDNQIGVFQSPANVSIGSVIEPVVNMTNDEQEDLNVPLNGKAVNAIRTFPGKGVLIWGARTLDGNSQDWRYISVRRTVIFIEQSIKYATEPYVFAPNTSNTWTNVKAMLTNFLTNVWQSGALAGATPADAFSVDVGLGATMTPIDILDGIMRVSVKIAVTRPAEFIVITFQQKMQQS